MKIISYLRSAVVSVMEVMFPAVDAENNYLEPDAKDYPHFSNSEIIFFVCLFAFLVAVLLIFPTRF